MAKFAFTQDCFFVWDREKSIVWYRYIIEMLELEQLYDLIPFAYTEFH